VSFIVNPYAFGGGGGPPATPHNAWRLFIDAADGSGLYCGFTELEMMTTLGGSTVTANDARAIASSAVGGNVASQAFDGNLTSSGWLSSGGVTNEWCGFNFTLFGAPPVAIVQIAIYTSWNVPTGSPKDFRLQWSDDLISWTDALVVTGQTGWTNGPPERRVFNV
jgi:hypothetical protein